MKQDIEELAIARIEGISALVRAYEFDEETGLWETEVLCAGGECDDYDFAEVNPKEMIPLGEPMSLGAQSASSAPVEWFHFEYAEWPLPAYDIEVALPAENPMAYIKLDENLNGAIEARVERAQIENELNALFGFIRTHAWEKSYERLCCDGYTWCLEMVAGNSHYLSFGSNDMPEYLPQIATPIDALAASATGTSVRLPEIRPSYI